jgi:guanyl-specific ribonuclease Sa
MKISTVPSTVRALLLAFTGVVLNSGPALAADLPYDAQAQLRAVIAGAPYDYSSRSDQSSAPLDSKESVSPIELQALVRQFILGTPGSDASRTQAAALNAAAIRLDARTYAEALHQVQRTLQGGAG